jgi:hypothetical protein
VMGGLAQVCARWAGGPSFALFSKSRSTTELDQRMGHGFSNSPKWRTARFSPLYAIKT